MDDLRRMLRDRADEVRLDPGMPAGVRKRARRRRAGNAAITALVVVGLGAASFVGARQLVGDRPIVPRPAEQPPSEDRLPVWPSFGAGSDDVGAIDAIQMQVDDGHQPWYLSPQIVAEVFAMEALEWKRGDVETSVEGTDPARVTISNPTLDGPLADVRTILTMERWRGRDDGIYVITGTDAEILVLRSPTPGQSEVPAEGLPVAGSLQGISQRLLALRLLVHIEGSSFFSSSGKISSVEVTEEGETSGGSKIPPELVERENEVVPGPDGEFEAVVPMPEEFPPSPGISVFIQDASGVKVAVESFRLGSATVPPPPTETDTLPGPVVQTRDAIVAAAGSGDWQALAALIDGDTFHFSFGGQRDPIAYWKRLEREGIPVREILTTLLRYPTVAYLDRYVWPTAAAKPSEEWTEADLEPLRLIYSDEELEQIRGADSYYGWRVGIEGDGTWIFFVAGD